MNLFLIGVGVPLLMSALAILGARVLYNPGRAGACDAFGDGGVPIDSVGWVGGGAEKTW